MNSQTNQQSGVVLITILVIMLALLSIGLTLSGLAITRFLQANRNVAVSNSLLLAEAGAEKTLHELNQDDNFAGFAEEQEFFDNNLQGRGTYQTTITEGSINNEKIITSTGRVYAPNSNELRVTRSVELVVVGTTALDYSVQTGPGGLIMRNSATIANGDVHVNGFIDMQNSARIGSESNPTTVHVAHIYCPDPADSTFPRQCEDGEGQPISIVNPAWIYAEVHATNQTDGSRMSNPGLIENSSADAIPLPSYDRPSQKDSIEQNMSSDQASCTQNHVTKIWQANTRITGGNVTISHSCEVIIEGDIWISGGGLTLLNSGRIRISNDLEEIPVIMIDGASGLEFKNSSTVLTNNNGFGAEFITFYSTAGCSPDCSVVTGTDLRASQDVTTIHLDNSSLAAGSRFYARWTKVLVNNGGSVGSVLGQTIELANSGNISFGMELSSGETVWAIKNYRQIFNHL